MILDSLLPAAASSYAGDIDTLFDVVTLLVGVPFAISCYLFFSFIFPFACFFASPSGDVCVRADTTRTD